MTRTIRLYGDLGKTFGEVFELAVESAGEAIRALSTQFEEFERYLCEAQSKNIGFRVRVADQDLTIDEIKLRSAGDIQIIPVIGGANAEARVLVGTALIVAASFMTGGAAAAFSGAGWALAIGGASEILIGKPKTPEIDERPENKPSYLFNGAVNTTAQGHPVPVGYGRMRVGSAVISAGMSTKSLMAGYRRITVEKFKTLMAFGSQDGLQEPAPEGWTRRELLDYQVGGYGGVWTWKYFYEETTMELIPV